MRRPARSERKNAFQTEKALAEGAIPSDKGHASRGRMKSPFRHVCTNRPSSAQQTAAGFLFLCQKNVWHRICLVFSDYGMPWQQSFLPLKKGKREAAAQRRPAQSEWRNRVFPRNDRPYGLKRKAFQTENALERFNFEKGETRGGGTAPPGPK